MSRGDRLAGLCERQVRKRSAPARLGIFLAILACLWLPIALPLYFFNQDLAAILLLYSLFLMLLWVKGRYGYRDRHPLQRWGLVISRQSGAEAIAGFFLAVGRTAVLFAIAGGLGWLAWRSPALPVGRLLLESTLVGFGVGFAEELFFRGWLLGELERDCAPRTALAIDAVVFALLHFVKPPAEMLRLLPAFFGLLLLGCTLVWAPRSAAGRLGLPIGLHAGFVWAYYWVGAGNIAVWQNRVPAWVTGADGNPLAGVLGLAGLGAIAWGFARRSRWIDNMRGDRQRSQFKQPARK